ncbi:MAG: GIY-YIG nuclease family protein [Patescibacteria group bacterium]|jgi:putative endonuclease
MYFTYVLRNEKLQIYVGYTNDLQKRFSLHQEKKVFSTRRMGGTWTLIYYEACLNQFDALARERYLKSGPGRAFLRKRIPHTLTKPM